MLLHPRLRPLDEPLGRGATRETPLLLTRPAVPGQLGAALVAAAVERVTLDPKDGKYITVKISAKSAADPQSILQGLIFGAGWGFVSKTGSRWMRLLPKRRPAASTPVGMKPNRSYNFDLVLDVPQETSGGVIVFDPGRSGGWALTSPT
jgi:hypothetical protein